MACFQRPMWPSISLFGDRHFAVKQVSPILGGLGRVTCLRRSSAGRMPLRNGSYSIRVESRHPGHNARSALLVIRSIRQQQALLKVYFVIK